MLVARKGRDTGRLTKTGWMLLRVRRIALEDDAFLSNSLLPGRQLSNNVLTSLMTCISVNPTRLTQWDMNGGRTSFGLHVIARLYLLNDIAWFSLRKDATVPTHIEPSSRLKLSFLVYIEFENPHSRLSKKNILILSRASPGYCPATRGHRRT